MIALLARKRNYISELARDIGLSRPLLYLHLGKLEAAGLVRVVHTANSPKKLEEN